jgi:antitoxin ParD1/3/4
MNVSLTPELEKLVDDKVASGMYHSASEVVREALRLLKEQDELRQQRLKALQSDIAIGLQQLDDGQSVVLNDETLQAIKHRGRARLAAQRGSENA